MATLAPPSSQKAGDRPISFLLDNQASGAPQAFVDLVIRPEDLTRADLSRMSVQQTFGGAWADNFGPGVPSISISGHTGWRRTLSDSDDGLARFLRLKENVFDQWHEQRQSNIAAGIDPNDVRLIFSDALHDSSVVVAPLSFTLRRSKSRPLLAQYQISMVVIDSALQNAPYPAQFGYNGAKVDPKQLKLSGLASLTASVNKITAMINNVNGWIQKNLVGPVKSFMQQTARLYGAVRGAVSAISGIAGSLISVAQMTAQAGVNIFRSLAAVANIPQIVKADLMAVAGAYSNIFCVLKNALREELSAQDYSALYGASNCSSTAGGRPISTLAGVNPFYQVAPTTGPLPLSVSQSASGSLRSFAAADPVLAPLSLGAIGTGLRSINTGLSIP